MPASARAFGARRDLPPLPQHGEATFHGAHQLARLGLVVPLRLALGERGAVAGEGGLVVGDGGLDRGERRRGGHRGPPPACRAASRCSTSPSRTAACSGLKLASRSWPWPFRRSNRPA